MASYPLFGLGISNFNNAECTISDLVLHPDPSKEAALCTAPHNSFVQAAAEMGVPGLIMWSSLVFGGAVGPLRLRRRMPKHWQVGDRDQRYLYRMTMYLPVAAIGYGVTAFFVSHAWMDMVLSLAAYNAGMYVAVSRRMWQERRESGQVIPHVEVPAPVRGRPMLPGRTA
jgi:O-antigen ligase